MPYFSFKTLEISYTALLFLLRKEAQVILLLYAFPPDNLIKHLTRTAYYGRELFGYTPNGTIVSTSKGDFI